MAYPLTQEDIDRLQLVDAVPGDLATPEEMAALGVEPTAPDGSAILPPDTPVAEQVIGAPAAPTAPAGNMSMQDLLAQLQGTMAPAEDDGDPYGKLSKTQRRMLAFAAISDAGRALQGKEGTMVTTLLGDFTARADQARKAKASALQTQMMQTLMGGGLIGGTDLSNFDPNAARQQIVTALTMKAIDGPTANILLDQVKGKEDRLSAAGKSRSLIADIDLLMTSEGLDQILGIKGIGTSALEAINLGALLPEAQEARGILEKIKGGIFLKAFESLKGGGQITELEGIKAEQAEARLKTTQDPAAFRDALNELRFYADIAARRSMGENIPPDTIYQRKVEEKTQPTETQPKGGDDLEQFYGGGSN